MNTDYYWGGLYYKNYDVVITMPYREPMDAITLLSSARQCSQDIIIFMVMPTDEKHRWEKDQIGDLLEKLFASISNR